MENFEELKSVMTEKKHLEDLITKVPSIHFHQTYGFHGEIIQFKDARNGTFSFNAVRAFLGDAEMDDLLVELKYKIQCALSKKREELEADIASYSIVKREYTPIDINYKIEENE